MIKTEVKLAFLDFKKPFNLYIDAREKELLGIVEGLKAFAGVICSQDLTVHTDHLNLLYNKLPNQRMMRWRLLLEEYNPKVVHVAGVDNDAAGVLSILDLIDKLVIFFLYGERKQNV